MIYSEHLPSAPLSPWIAAYWYFQVDDNVSEIDHWIPPNGGVMFSVSPGAPAMLIGPRTDPNQVIVVGGTRFWGAIFWPGAAASLLHIDMESIRSNYVPVQSVLRHQPIERLNGLAKSFENIEAVVPVLNAFFERMTPDASPLDDCVMQVVHNILNSPGETTVRQATNDIGLSARQLRRRFRQAVGLTPKELLRVQRIRVCSVKAVKAIKTSWINLAADLGYADQAHLTREFRKLMGITPGEFEKHFRDIEHRNLIR